MVLSLAGFLDNLEASGVTEKGVFATVGVAFFVIFWLWAWNCGVRWQKKRERFALSHIKTLAFSRGLQPTVFWKETRKFLLKFDKNGKIK